MPAAGAERLLMIEARLTLRAGSRTRQVALADYLDPAAEEAAHGAEYNWIKALRQLPVDGVPLRDRFTARGDSLWWFTELYLHKRQLVLDIHRAVAATNALIDREGPAQVIAVASSPAVAYVVQQVAAARSVRAPSTPRRTWWRRLAALDARARMLTLSALATPERWRHAPESAAPTAIAAFIHRAFWQSGSSDGSAESYTGAILSELERRVGGDALRFIGVGPATNFRAHRRLARAAGGTSSVVVPVERFANLGALRESRAVWRRRYADYRAMTRAASIREASRIQGIDCWPIVREELAGVAWLQWPWSVRAMDEAAAALDALHPRGVVTYAEAGGWGRALILEARRRGIPSVGLQHGFIYRHWLNYRHEPDELEPRNTPAFPCPTLTLVYDDHAARHLAEQGRLPPAGIRVTGSPRLEALAAEISALTPEAIRRVRQRANLGEADRLVLVTTKEKEARDSLPRFLDAATRIRGVAVSIKPHPAETAGAYARYIRRRERVTVWPSDAPLAPLLAAADVVVTVNSTVAIDAAALGIAALAIGLPNNLTPFVDAGVIAGSVNPSEEAALLERILYDERFREQLAAQRRKVFGPPVTGRERRAAARSAEAVLELVHHPRPTAQAG